MSYGICGNPLRRGHCEVHPHVHEEYPCSVCVAESRRHQEAQSPAQCNGNSANCESAHYLDRALEEIKRLNDEIQALRKDAERFSEAFDLLKTMFKEWENGPACYNDGDPDDYIGNAFRLDDKTFRACVAMLNGRNQADAVMEQKK